MSLEDDQDDRPHRDFTELLPIGLAAILTAAAVGLWFFRFSAGAPATPQAPPPSEITIGIGDGSNIHPPTTPPPKKADPFVP